MVLLVWSLIAATLFPLVVLVWALVVLVWSFVVLFCSLVALVALVTLIYQFFYPLAVIVQPFACPVVVFVVLSVGAFVINPSIINIA